MFPITRADRSWIAFVLFTAIILFLLTTEHRAHVLGVLPYLFLLACPFLHMFMHHGHHGHREPDEPDEHRHHPAGRAP